MSFIQCYKFAKKHTQKPLSDLEVSEIIKIEKLLKIEARITPDLFSTNDIENFLDALKNKIELLQYLGRNQDFYDVLFGRINSVSNSIFVCYDTFDANQLRHEAGIYLIDELNALIVAKAGQEQYWALKILLNFQVILPLQVLNLLENRIDYKLDVFIKILEKGNRIKDEVALAKITEIVQLLDSKPLAKKVAKIHQTQREIAREVFEHINKPGIVMFFSTVFLGLVYLFYEPTDLAEKRKKKRVMGDFYFTIGILAFIALILYIGFSIVDNRVSNKKDSKIKQAKSFYGSFSDPYANDVLFIGPYSDTLKTGFDFMSSRPFANKGKSQKLLIENNTDSDLIVFSDFINHATLKEMKLVDDNGSYIYIKKKDTLSIQTRNQPMYFYFGNQLYSVKTSGEQPANLPRFLMAHPSNKKLLMEPLDTRVQKISFKDSLQMIVVSSGDKFISHGINYTTRAF